ncbi:Gibberellin 2-beta-dioxygenase 1 [Stylosanthes scabra]|uniref:Gibberellin 2-beta-dioxygenase 1 n=1 Tax=Stylosanthes scabra TaxID=79078 RepID=A0ABU6UEM9_9FABA|nr:Gibberellin 2-beta-dioxygenase 1 [Stylosanthes scabra]
MQYSYVRNCSGSNNRAATFSPPVVTIPIVDLSKPDAQTLIVKACEDFGFFKVINHGVPTDAISKLEEEATKFFSLPQSDKENVGLAKPFGYGSKCIGYSGDVGLIEYLLVKTNSQHTNTHTLDKPEQFRCALNEYIEAMRKMACEILELMAEGLNIEERNVLSKLVMDEQSDSCFRLNHYPACPEITTMASDNEKNTNKVGFGEHTDPQIISLLRSNNTAGLQIYVGDGNWIPVPPDHSSFFVNVGDALQVMTNGRFKSVRHRVIVDNANNPRLSMIYFVGPPLSEKIAPLPSLMLGKESLYKEFTWFEYKNSTYHTKLAVNRLIPYERIAAS